MVHILSPLCVSLLLFFSIEAICFHIIGKPNENKACWWSITGDFDSTYDYLHHKGIDSAIKFN